MIEVDSGSTTDVLREENLDVYEGIHSEIVNTTRFDENSELSTTYFRKSDGSKNNKLKAEESFPISEHWYTSGKLLDGTECQSLLDTGASKLFMPKSFYMHCKSLHTLPKFASKTLRIQVGNGWFVSVLFITPVIIDVQIDVISDLAIIKILDVNTCSTMLLKVKSICNTATLDIINNGA